MAQPTTDDVYLYQSSDPHTAIPDWLAFCGLVSAEARNMAHAILVLSRGAIPPTRAEIAESLGVDLRTVQRWLAELRSAGILQERAVGRRQLCIFRRPGMGDTCVMGDRAITRPTDQVIARSPDRAITHDTMNRDHSLGQGKAPNGAFFQNPISDPLVGVVGDKHESDSDSTTPTPAPLKTRLARWLKQAGMNAARDFDDDSLDFDTYVRFVKDKRQMGWEWRQIVSTLREAPLEPAPAVAALYDLVDDEPASDEPASDKPASSAFSEQVRQELIAAVNQRPKSYHGVSK